MLYMADAGTAPPAYIPPSRFFEEHGDEHGVEVAPAYQSQAPTMAPVAHFIPRDQLGADVHAGEGGIGRQGRQGDGVGRIRYTIDPALRLRNLRSAAASGSARPSSDRHQGGASVAPFCLLTRVNGRLTFRPRDTRDGS